MSGLFLFLPLEIDVSSPARPAPCWSARAACERLPVQLLSHHSRTNLGCHWPGSRPPRPEVPRIRQARPVTILRSSPASYDWVAFAPRLPRKSIATRGAIDLKQCFIEVTAAETRISGRMLADCSASITHPRTLPCAQRAEAGGLAMNHQWYHYLGERHGDRQAGAPHHRAVPIMSAQLRPSCEGLSPTSVGFASRNNIKNVGHARPVLAGPKFFGRSAQCSSAPL